MEKISGIYKIENIINKKLYIGSSCDIKQRWEKHKSQLKNNKHSNKYLQYAFNKYKLENFNFEIIEKCLEFDLFKKEQFYIDLYKNENILYNGTFIVGGGFNRKIKIIKNCKQCKKIFKVPPCFKLRSFCSKKCHDKNKIHNIIVNCKNCNKKLKVTKSTLKRNCGKFCSRKCVKIFKSLNPSGIFVKCKFCDTSFKTKKSRLKNSRGKFCSKECSNNYHKINKN